MHYSFSSIKHLVLQNWQPALTVTFIAIPLSIALSVASGAGPLPGIIAGIWATLIAGLFGGSNYNIIGAAGALSSVLFAATLAAPLGLGPQVLPLIALVSGAMILAVWAVRGERFLYYVPSSVMYGFAAGVAFLIAASQLFDATGLSALKRTGSFVGDIRLFVGHVSEVQGAAILTFTAFLVFILVWKRFIKRVPAVIPAAILGIAFGYYADTYQTIELTSLRDKFGSFEAALWLPVVWGGATQVLKDPALLTWIIKCAALVAVISVLETLLTAKIADVITRTQSSARRELLGLGLANLGSGAMGGLPATGVFIRTGANIKAGATHRMSAILAAIFTAAISLVVLGYFAFIPMAVIAAMLVNTAIGLIETEKFVEFYQRERYSFWVALLVMGVTVVEDAGVAVCLGVVVALLLFANRVSRGYFDVIFNFEDGTKLDQRHVKVLKVPEGKDIAFVTYSIAGFLCYIDSERHAANLKHLSRVHEVPTVILRLRNLFSVDIEGEDMLVDAIGDLERAGKKVYISSDNEEVVEGLLAFPALAHLRDEGRVFEKSSDAIKLIRPEWRII